MHGPDRNGFTRIGEEELEAGHIGNFSEFSNSRVKRNSPVSHWKSGNKMFYLLKKTEISFYAN